MNEKNLIDGKKPEFGNKAHIDFVKANQALVKVSTYIPTVYRDRLGEIAKGQPKKTGRVEYYAQVYDGYKPPDKHTGINESCRLNRQNLIMDTNTKTLYASKEEAEAAGILDATPVDEDLQAEASRLLGNKSSVKVTRSNSTKLFDWCKKKRKKRDKKNKLAKMSRKKNRK